MWILNLLNLGISEGNTQKAESTSREILFRGKKQGNARVLSLKLYSRPILLVDLYHGIRPLSFLLC